MSNKDFNRNPNGTNQWELRTDEELQRIIDSKHSNWTKKDFRGEGINNKTKIFTRKDLKEHKLIQKLEEIKEEISSYYLPCKRKVYLEDLTIKKSITILRQILKLYDYVVKSNERWIKGEKIIVYQILPKNSLKKPINSNDKCIISFD